MKLNRKALGAFPLVLAGVIATFAYGCSKSSPTSSGPGGAQGPVVSGRPNGANLAQRTGPNVMSMTVDGSQCSSSPYPNKPCVSVTICEPGTATCQTVNDLLVDTGSVGLRVFKSAIPNLNLNPVTLNGKTITECVSFLDNSSDWGPLESASVTLGGEDAITIPIQVIDSTYSNSASYCNGAETSPASAGGNGILGVGLMAVDCGAGCVNTPNNRLYYTCNGTTCTQSSMPIANQIPNPVTALSVDNNGVVLELPSIPLGGVPSLNGYLILGIGTGRGNNDPTQNPTQVNVMPADPTYGEFTTTFNGQTYSSFLDSGSNALFFPDPSIPDCGTVNAGLTGWFCPPVGTTLNLSALNMAYGGSPQTNVPFLIGSFYGLDISGNLVFIEAGGTQTGLFDWGLPSYIGYNVYVGIEGASSTLGTGPYWAY